MANAVKKKKVENDEFFELLGRTRPALTIYTLLLNKDAIDRLENEAGTHGVKKTALARLAINYAIKQPEFWKMVGILKGQKDKLDDQV